MNVGYVGLGVLGAELARCFVPVHKLRVWDLSKAARTKFEESGAEIAADPASLARESMLSFMAFATASVVRPNGGIIRGHLGDRIGRKTVLYQSFILMGASTTLIGFLPTYEVAGPTGAILLVLLRVLQGLSVGGEYGGAVVTLVEHAHKSRRDFFGTLSQVGTLLGLLLGNATFFLMTGLDAEALMAWGWRVPFLLSSVMLVLGMFIRARMSESPDFIKAKDSGAAERQPLMVAVKEYPRQLISVMFAQAAPTCSSRCVWSPWCHMG